MMRRMIVTIPGEKITVTNRGRLQACVPKKGYGWLLFAADGGSRWLLPFVPGCGLVVCDSRNLKTTLTRFGSSLVTVAVVRWRPVLRRW